MPTIVDSLIVTLGLDPANFNKGQKEATAAFLKTRDAAVKSGKDIEDASTKAANAISRITREVIVLFGALAGARNLSQLISGLTEANAELGRFSANMAMAPQAVAGWGAAVQRVGGNMGSFQQTVGNLTKQLFDLRTGIGNLPEAFFQLQARTGTNINPFGSTEKYISGIGEAIKKLSATDRNGAFQFAQQLGIDPATFELMRQHGAEVNKYVDGIAKSIAPSQKAIEAAQKLQAAWYEMAQQVGSLINKLYELAGPAITEVLTKMSAWLDKNKEWIAAKITAAIERFVELLQLIDWEAMGTRMSQFAVATGNASEAIGDLTNAVEILFGLWLGSKFLKVLANMRLLAAGGAAGGAAAGGAAAGAGGAAAVVGSMLLLGGSSANNPYSKMSAEERAAAREDARADAEIYRRRFQSGPQNGRRGYFRGESERDASLGSFLSGADATVDGRPVSRSNPMPVTLATPSSGGGGFWESITNWLTGGSSGSGGGSGGVTGAISNAVGTLLGVSSANAAIGPASPGDPSAGGSRSWRNNNPGNMEYGEFAKSMGATGSDGRFAIFPDYKTGRQAQEKLLFESKNYRDLTLAQAINRWAPSSDGNNTAAYIDALTKGSGVSGDSVMSSIPAGDRAKILDLMQQHEGWKPGRPGNLSYINQNATRKQALTPKLEAALSEAIQSVYGDGYAGQIYSGGQPHKGSGLARIGSTRHDAGNAADVYIVGPDGKRLTGDQLGPLAQYWLARGHGGVGMEMAGGGIHLDSHKDRAKNWWYGRATAGQRDAVQAGLDGILPPLTGAAASAAMNQISNDNRRSVNSNIDTRVGAVHIHTQATDSASIADTFWGDLDRRINRGASQVAATNSGPQ